MSVDGLFVENWFLAFVRTLSVLAVAPVFSMRNVPTLVKVGLGAAIAYVLTLARSTQLAPLSGQLAPFLIAIAKETMVGLLIGFAAALAFAAFQVAAQAISLQLGFSLGAILNPGVALQGTASDQLYLMLATLFFLAINGHHLLLLSLGQTLEVAPLGTFTMQGGMVETLIRISSTAISAGVQLAMPILGAVLLTDLALGIINRAVPQMSAFIIGLPLKVFIGLLALLLALPATTNAAVRLLSEGARAGFFLLGE
jgi:flagellar biosynthetic protein FliR